jgi:hypothetical protein
MNRRNALKNIGLSLGYVVATPTVISLLQSCKNDAKNLTAWIPEFFSSEEGKVMKILVDLILPKTDNLPGVLDLNIPEFIDLYMAKVYDDDEQNEAKKGINAIMTALDITENNPSNIKTETYDAFLAKYLRVSKEEREAFAKNDKIILGTLSGLRDLTVWAYKTTEEIGENVLAYDPIPGEQKGCVSLEEATGGKEWSL